MSEQLKFNLTTTDGSQYEVKAIFADLIKYDVLRARNNFPGREGNEFLFMGLLSFCALVRTGKLPAGTNVEEFLNTIEAIEPQVEDEAEFRTESGN